jgi:hypothetical protein
VRCLYGGQLRQTGFPGEPETQAVFAVCVEGAASPRCSSSLLRCRPGWLGLQGGWERLMQECSASTRGLIVRCKTLAPALFGYYMTWIAPIEEAMQRTPKKGRSWILKWCQISVTAGEVAEWAAPAGGGGPTVLERITAMVAQDASAAVGTGARDGALKLYGSTLRKLTARTGAQLGPLLHCICGLGLHRPGLTSLPVDGHRWD